MLQVYDEYTEDSRRPDFISQAVLDQISPKSTSSSVSGSSMLAGYEYKWTEVAFGAMADVKVVFGYEQRVDAHRIRRRCRSDSVECREVEASAEESKWDMLDRLSLNSIWFSCIGGACDAWLRKIVDESDIRGWLRKVVHRRCGLRVCVNGWGHDGSVATRPSGCCDGKSSMSAWWWSVLPEGLSQRRGK